MILMQKEFVRCKQVLAVTELVVKMAQCIWYELNLYLIKIWLGFFSTQEQIEFWSRFTCSLDHTEIKWKYQELTT